MMINLSHMATFIAVAESGGFRAAADRLFVSPPAVSTRIKQLELSLGVRLFHRTTRSVTLTGEGTRLLAAATNAVSELNRVTDQLRSESHLSSGSTSVATMFSLASTIFPPLLKSFSERYPNLSVGLVDATADVAVDHLLDGRCDLAVTARLPLNRLLRFETLFREDCFAVVPRAHSLSAIRVLGVEQLDKATLLVPPRGSAFRTQLDHTLAETGLQVDLKDSNSTSTSIALAESGHGIALITRSYRAKVDLTRCRVVRLKNDFLSRDVGLVTVEHRALSPAAAALKAFIRKKWHDRTLYSDSARRATLS